MGFDTKDILREAGYSEGDFLPIYTAANGGFTRITTSSSSYVSSGNNLRQETDYDNLFPSGAQPAVLLTATINPGSGEEAFIQVTQDDGSDPIPGSELSTTTLESISTGWVEFSPISGVGAVLCEVKTEPGSNSSTFDNFAVTYGVKL